MPTNQITGKIGKFLGRNKLSELIEMENLNRPIRRKLNQKSKILSQSKSQAWMTSLVNSPKHSKKK